MIVQDEKKLKEKTEDLKVKLKGIETAFKGKSGSFSSSLPKAMSVLFQNSIDEKITLWESEQQPPVEE